ncbi:hypothetical protein SLG_23280 [Sphingobium sp. SYK-6]|uniref:TPM domain-containing protein n=1 Tax=Sphingobium sp. (strain NBRC 103272 / SYK-6) TaxID=627192 RepID=UPI00022772CE|nr:TPM domain-containing protein [Sphingobium sp. SYK-6]BAK67003.1 hypothetical protein SLG_23280 [Sphingobium sp. SYK-6]
MTGRHRLRALQGPLAAAALLIIVAGGPGLSACGHAQPAKSETRPATDTTPSEASAPEASPRAPGHDLALAGRVTDAAALFSPAERDALTRDLSALEARTGHQLVVATVPTLGGRDIAGYARDLGNRWGIGREGIDDGVVILVAPREQLVRIAVGYGMEARLTDETCQSIIEQEMIPAFAQGQMFEGVRNGVAAIAARL